MLYYQDLIEKCEDKDFLCDISNWYDNNDATMLRKIIIKKVKEHSKEMHYFINEKNNEIAIDSINLNNNIIKNIKNNNNIYHKKNLILKS